MKAFLAMCTLCALLLGVTPVVQAAVTDPVTQLDGHVWMESGKSEKLAVIWGADCAVFGGIRLGAQPFGDFFLNHNRKRKAFF